MKIVDIADEIFQDLEEPTNLSIPKIAYWLRYNIGKLNVLLDLEVVVDETTMEFSPELSEDERDIFSELYIIKYYDDLARKSLGANAYDAIEWLSLTEIDGTKITRINKNEVAKTYQQLKRDHMTDLNELVAKYRINRARPLDYKYQVT